MNPYRDNIISFLQLIAREEEQLDYQAKAPNINVAVEMCNQWFDDFYHLDFAYFVEQFSEKEFSSLKEFNDLFEQHVASFPETLEELHVYKNWALIKAKANFTLSSLDWKKFRQGNAPN